MNDILIWSLASALVASSLATLLCHWQERRAWKRWAEVRAGLLLPPLQAIQANRPPGQVEATNRQNRCLR
jgi:hypothetical protein